MTRSVAKPIDKLKKICSRQNVIGLSMTDIKRIVDENVWLVWEILDLTPEEEREIQPLKKLLAQIRIYLSSKNIKEINKSLRIYDIEYEKLTDEIKAHLKNDYYKLFLYVSNEMILYHLKKSLWKYRYVEVNCTGYISKILEIVPNFDFSIYNNEDLNEAVEYYKRLKRENAAAIKLT